MKQVIEKIQKQFPSIQFGRVKLPDNHSLNDMFTQYGPEAILTLLEEAELINEEDNQRQAIASESDFKPSAQLTQPEEENDAFSALRLFNSQKIGFQGKVAMYFVLGGFSAQTDPYFSLKTDPSFSCPYFQLI